MTEEVMEIEVDGLRTHAVSLGTGPAIVCVHGGLGSDHQVFRPWLEPLATEFRLILVDLQGNGRSDDPDDWDAVGLHTWAAQLHGLREALGLERWTVLGHSFGGIVAQAYALAHPADLSALLVVTSGSRVDDWGDRWAVAARHATPEQLALMQSGLLRTMESDEAFEEVWARVVSAYWVDKSFLPHMRRRSRYSSRAFNKAVEILPTVDFTAALPSLRVPTLVVAGAEDWSFPPAAGPRLTAELIPGATYLEYARSGHYPFVEEQDAFLADVGAWLRATLG